MGHLWIVFKDCKFLYVEQNISFLPNKHIFICILFCKFPHLYVSRMKKNTEGILKNINLSRKNYPNQQGSTDQCQKNEDPNKFQLNQTKRLFCLWISFKESVPKEYLFLTRFYESRTSDLTLKIIINRGKIINNRTKDLYNFRKVPSFGRDISDRAETLCVLTQMKRGSWRTTEWIVAGLFPFGWLCGQDKMAPSGVFSTAITMRLIGQERVRESFADECPRYRPPLKGKRSEEADANAEKISNRFSLLFVFRAFETCIILGKEYFRKNFW